MKKIPVSEDLAEFVKLLVEFVDSIEDEKLKQWLDENLSKLILYFLSTRGQNLANKNNEK